MTLNKFRTKELIWDKAGKRIYESIEANSGDSNGRKLVVQVLDGGVTADLSGAQLYLSWKTYTNKHKGLDAFKAVNLSEGIFEIAYTTEMLSNVGKLSASLVLIDKVGRVESNLFTITVSRSNVDDESVQSEDSFTALTEALVTIANVNAQLAQKAQQSALEAEKERINNLISLPEGSTTNDARLEDITIGYDGEVYDSPGNAVRNQLVKKANQTDVIFPVKNELENYNFASGELTPWEVLNGSTEFGGHGVKVTWNGSQTYTMLRYFYTFTVGRKYYLSFKGAVFNAGDRTKFLRTYLGPGIYFRENIINARAPFPNQESYLFQPSINADIFSFGILDPQSGDNFSISEVFLIDLTELFGVGKEPTKEEFEVFLSYIPDGWVNRVVSNKEVTRYLFETLTKGTSDVLSDLEEIKQSIADIVGEQHDN